MNFLETPFNGNSQKPNMYPKKHEQFLVSLKNKNLNSNIIWRIFRTHFKYFSDEEQATLLNHPNFPEERLVENWELLNYETIIKIAAFTKSTRIMELITKEEDFVYFIAPNRNINDKISCKILEHAKKDNFSDLDLKILDNPVFPEQFKHYLMENETLKVLPVYFYEKHFSGFKYPLSMLKLFRQDLLFGAGPVWVPQVRLNLFNVVQFRTLARKYGKVEKGHIGLENIERRVLRYFKNDQNTVSLQRYSTSFVDDVSLPMRLLKDPEIDSKTFLRFADDFLKTCMLFRDNVPENILESLANSDNHFIRFLVATNPSVTSRVLKQLLYLGPDYVRFEVLNSDNFKNDAIFDKIIESDNVEDRRNIARNKNLSFDHMVSLANDEDVVVRTLLSLNSSAPKVLKNIIS